MPNVSIKYVEQKSPMWLIDFGFTSLSFKTDVLPPNAHPREYE